MKYFINYHTGEDGWHRIAGYNVLVENGKIIRGTLGEGTSNYRAAWPYRLDTKNLCWNNCAGITPAAFRAGVKRGTVTLK